jgi:pyruvate/2-oxoglutarate dehydrogenase complex dihydrolipoamide acyltransferase (E2) component
MDTPVVMPQLGNEIEEAQVDGWMKAVGEEVKAGEALLTITTPKITIEVEAPVSGTLAKILVEAEELASVGATLAIISTP